MSKDRRYMREYMLARYYRRRQEAIDKLGGKCYSCESVEDLEFDHIDPDTKEFSIAKGFAGFSEERIQKELKKCQLLCKECHAIKSLPEITEKAIERERNKRMLPMLA